jgi:hypothetical protein
MHIDDPDDPGAVVTEKHGSQRPGGATGKVEYCNTV